MVLVMSRTTVNCVRSDKILLGHVKKVFSCPFSHYTVVLAHAVQLHTQIRHALLENTMRVRSTSCSAAAAALIKN